MRSKENQGQSRLAYRVYQFLDALWTSPLTESDLHLVSSLLTRQQIKLFRRLQMSEQTHGLRVLQSLRDQGEEHPALLAAALLHDIGKVRHPLSLWERVVIVLAKKLFPGRVTDWGRGKPVGWKRPFVVSCEHPEWGAQLVSQTGASPLLVALIRDHQHPCTAPGVDPGFKRLLAALQKADSQN